MTHEIKEFNKADLIVILENIINKTLGEVDKNNVFNKTVKHPKITGIAGDVIEESVLEYPSNSRQEADILVDGVETEVKTTGLRIKSGKNKVNRYDAKEPMTITAVTPEKIVSEIFSDSNFWKKLENLLLIYYLYDSKETVPAAGYANFPIKGYEFHEFNENEIKILEQDWTIVRNFIQEIQNRYEIPEDEYPRISSELRPHLMMIDTAPKWPNRPRFRLKRATVTTIVQQYFGKQFEKLDKEITSFKELEKQLEYFTLSYKGKSIKELLHILEIPVNLNKSGDVSKNVTEQIVTSMFGAKSKKMADIELFSEIGLISKTITLTKEGYRTEDTKLMPVDFSEWSDNTVNFIDSSIYEYFSQNQFLFIVFEEQNKDDKLLDNIFLGFKRLVFSEKFIETEVKRTWVDTRRTLFDNKLEETIVCYSSGENKGQAIINKNGTVRTQVNLPKSKEYPVFFRGTGSDSSNKPETVNGIAMYRHNIWIKGNILTERLKDLAFI